MTILVLFEWSAVVLGTTLVVSCLILVGVKHQRDRRAHAAAAHADVLRPALLAALHDPSVPLPVESSAHRAALEDVAGSLLVKIKGADRLALARMLEREGSLARARTGLSARRAPRRQRSAELLGAAGDRSALPTLLDRLVDRDAAVRAAAARALGRIGDARAVGPLLSAALHHRVPVNTATMAILRIGPDAAPPLREALDLGLPTERGLAADLLGVLGDAESVGALAAMVAVGDVTSGQAATALGRIGAPAAVPVLVDRLTLELSLPTDVADQVLMVTLATALGEIGDRRAIPVLTDALGRSRRLSLAAAAALGPMGPRRSRRSMAERTAPSEPIAPLRTSLAASIVDGS